MLRLLMITIALLGAAVANAQGVEKQLPGDVGYETEEGTPLAVSPMGIIGQQGMVLMQEYLQREGIDTAPTGWLDPGTETSLMVYQQRQGLARTGMPDMETLKRLGIEPQRVYGALPGASP